MTKEKKFMDCKTLIEFDGHESTVESKAVIAIGIDPKPKDDCDGDLAILMFGMASIDDIINAFPVAIMDIVKSVTKSKGHQSDTIAQIAAKLIAAQLNDIDPKKEDDAND